MYGIIVSSSSKRKLEDSEEFGISYFLEFLPQIESIHSGKIGEKFNRTIAQLCGRARALVLFVLDRSFASLGNMPEDAAWVDYVGDAKAPGLYGGWLWGFDTEF